MSENLTFILKDKVAFLSNWAVLRGVLDHIDSKFDVESNSEGPGDQSGFLISNLLT